MRIRDLGGLVVRFHRHVEQQAPARGREPPAGCAQVRPRPRAVGPDFALRPARALAPAPAREPGRVQPDRLPRSEEHTSELQSLMRISYAVFCLKKKKKKIPIKYNTTPTTIYTYDK